MEQAKELVEKILSNQVTGFFFVLACAVGATIGIAGSYWVALKIAIFVGAN